MGWYKGKGRRFAGSAVPSGLVDGRGMAVARFGIVFMVLLAAEEALLVGRLPPREVCDVFMPLEPPWRLALRSFEGEEAVVGGLKEM